MQYFLGFSAFSDKQPFSPAMPVYFWKRLGKDNINEVNEMIAMDPATEHNKDDDRNDNDGHDGEKAETGQSSGTQERIFDSKGTLILDATCAPADIHYPTDLWLLNEVREALEEIIDVLHESHIGQSKKPRTYRQSARKDYRCVDRKKHKTTKEIRKGIGKQLRYIKRDLKIIELLASKSQLSFK